MNKLISLFSSLFKSLISRRYLLFPVIICICGFYSCIEKKSKQENQTWEGIISTYNFSTPVQKLMLDRPGILRGFNFDSDSSLILANETANLVQKGENYINYSIDFDQFDAADIIYHFPNDETVDMFEVVLYMKDKANADSILVDLREYLKIKFGEPTLQGDTILAWDDSINNIHARLQFPDENKYKDMQLLIFKSSNEIP